MAEAVFNLSKKKKKSLLTYAVAHPGAVVVELCHASVADGAVLGAKRSSHQAGGTEPGGVKAILLGQFNDCLHKKVIDPNNTRDVYLYIYSVST